MKVFIEKNLTQPRILGKLIESRKRVVMLMLMAPFAVSVSADPRCDCSPSKRGETCTSEISQTGNWITLTSTSKQCSQVIWYADGESRTTTILNGRETEEWLGSGKPQLEVESCQVCFDRQATSQSNNTHSSPKSNVSKTECTGYKMVGGPGGDSVIVYSPENLKFTTLEEFEPWLIRKGDCVTVLRQTEAGQTFLRLRNGREGYIYTWGFEEEFQKQ